MTTEMMIFVFLFIALVIGAVFSVKTLYSLDKENEELQDLLLRQQYTISEYECVIERMDAVLAKKDSLISILQTEIEEKEKKK